MAFATNATQSHCMTSKVMKYCASVMLSHLCSFLNVLVHFRALQIWSLSTMWQELQKCYFRRKKNHIGLEQHKGEDINMYIHTFGRRFYLKHHCIYITHILSVLSFLWDSNPWPSAMLYFLSYRKKLYFYIILWINVPLRTSWCLYKIEHHFG